MIFLSAGIIALSQFLPMATMVVNATPGVKVEIVALLEDGSYSPVEAIQSTFTAGKGPRRLQVRIPNNTKLLCAQTIPGPPEPNTVSLRYRSCAALKLPPGRSTDKFKVQPIL